MVSLMDKQELKRQRLAKWKAQQAAKKSGPAPLKLAVPKLAQNRISLEGEDPPAKKAKPEAAQFDLDQFLDNLEQDNAIENTELYESGSDVDETFSDAAVDPLQYLEQVEKGKRKEIPKVDHTQQNYHEFRKSFYKPPEELVFGDELEVVRETLGVTVKNDDTKLAPISEWEQLGLPRPLLEVIQTRSMAKPTPIQSQSLPLIMSGKDVIGIAPTGSGKTIAFVLPLIRQVLDQLPEVQGVKSIVLSPTRELCLQTYREVEQFAGSFGIVTLGAAGGTRVKPQIDAIKRNVDIVVATPGRMIDLLAANGGRILSLHHTTLIVIDEADRMFDMGFAPQVKRIIENVRPDRQTVVISATFPPMMEKHIRQILHSPVLIEVGTRSSVSQDVDQMIEIVPQETKFLSLLKILGGFYKEKPDGQAIVFVDRQEPSDQLAEQLTARGYKCRSIHGGHEQSTRDETLSLFRRGDLPLLVATSVAARGLDVKGLGLVVNYDPPNHLEDYVHRVGRTGRAGQKGQAVTFLTSSQSRAARDIVKALKISQKEVPEEVAKLASEFAPTKKIQLSGFGGSGLDKLDTERAEKRKAQIENDNPTPQPGSPTDQSTAEPEAEPIPQPAQPIVKVGPAPGIKGPATSNFHTTLEINDFPQAARMAVTSFQNQSKIIETHAVSITNRGTFYPPGKDGPDKLYLAIEGPTEAAVSNAYHDLASFLREGIDKSSKVGKYSV